MKILIVVLSCHKNSNRWPKIKEKLNGNGIIFCGGDRDSSYDKYNNILQLKCNDYYEGLPEKVICMIDQILKLPIFDNVTHIFKIDDYDYIRNNVLTQRNIDDIYKLDTILKNDYVGGQVLYGKGDTKWHFNKVTKNSYWDDREYVGEYVPWCGGGYGYVLSINAMKIINAHHNTTNLDEISQNDIYEDLMIAKILKRNGNINPVRLNYSVGL